MLVCFRILFYFFECGLDYYYIYHFKFLNTYNLLDENNNNNNNDDESHNIINLNSYTLCITLVTQLSILYKYLCVREKKKKREKK